MVNAGHIFIEVMVTLVQIADIDKQFSSLLTRISDVTPIQCVAYITRNPLYVWTVYNSERRECIMSLCGSLPVLEHANSSNIYYRKVNDKRVSSCSDVKTASPMSGDGEYWIYPDAPTFLGCPTKIYCHNMASASPSEFVTLQFTNTGVYPNLANYDCRGERNLKPNEGNHGTTYFNKIRIYPESMKVKQNDYTFSSHTGGSYMYARASDCYVQSTKNWCGGPKGTFHIDTRSTGILVDLQQKWRTMGWLSFSPKVTRSSGGREIHLRCGGYCGGCKPTGDLQLHRNPDEVLPPESATFIRP